jgi:hypothetical protein
MSLLTSLFGSAISKGAHPTKKNNCCDSSCMYDALRMFLPTVDTCALTPLVIDGWQATKIPKKYTSGPGTVQLASVYRARTHTRQPISFTKLHSLLWSAATHLQFERPQSRESFVVGSCRHVPKLPAVCASTDP